jgi:pyridoxal phosphate enzyme (YggS family)
MIEQTLQKNLAAVEERLVAACRRAGRSRAEVTLVAVTKSVSVDVAGYLAALGIHHLGENRPQELMRKAALLSPAINWHLIGHLQRNKVERTLPLVCFIHSVDSVRLLQALDQEAGKQCKMLDVLLEVNASGEGSKQGFRLDEVPPLTPALRALRYVRVKGLMTMAALQEPETCRPTFALLRAMRDRLRSELAPAHNVEHLSMGMSNDFEVAVEEGATFVRLGSVLFQGLS